MQLLLEVHENENQGRDETQPEVAMKVDVIPIPEYKNALFLKNLKW